MGIDAEPRRRPIASIGSNINHAQMLNRVGEVGTVGTAILRDHILIFDKPDSRHPGYAAANIRPQKGSIVRCLVQELSPEQITRLDTFERNYTRKPHTVELPDGTTKEVDIYVAGITVPGLKPHTEYLDIILKGVREVFPKEYLNEVLQAAENR